MNMIHMRYAVEVAKCGSLGKAAEILLVAQSNLSRCIKGLEDELGIVLFQRSGKGMKLTPEGEQFINYAQGVLDQLSKIETLYRSNSPQVQKFSISVPSSGYIRDAFRQFSGAVDAEYAEISYQETGLFQAIDNILKQEYRLGILRYPEKQDSYFRNILKEKRLVGEWIISFRCQLLMRRDHPLAQKEQLYQEDLRDYIELVQSDSLFANELVQPVKLAGMLDSRQQRIFVCSSTDQYDILAGNPKMFMWSSPESQRILDRYDLVQRECCDNTVVCRDMLIHRENYQLTDLDDRFITDLCQFKRKYFPSVD